MCTFLSPLKKGCSQPRVEPGAGVNSILRTCSWLYSQEHHKKRLAPDLSRKLVLSHCSHELLLGQNLQTLKSLCYQVCYEG